MYKPFTLSLLLLALCGCTSTKYIPVESVRTEYIDRDVERLVSDTVRDTRLVFIKGDTVLDIRDRWHIQREYIHDTLKVILTDTIRVPYPVERNLTHWERAKQDVGGMAIGMIVLAICAAVVWLVRKLKKRN